MKHKVFYSWQSDHKAAISSSLIRDALVDAISGLGSGYELDEAMRGASGTPDIAATIFAKISACSVFVPDLTVVAEYAPGRFTSNPNVLVEHGYAISEIGPERIVPVVNLHFGGPEKLPFDVRGKWVGVQYDLGCEAETEARLRVRRKLAEDLMSQIQAVVDGAIFGGLSLEARRAIEALVTQAENGGDERGLEYAEFCAVAGVGSKREALHVVDELLGCDLVWTFPGVGSPFHHVRQRPELFWKFDRLFMGWNPEHDAKLLASRLIADSEGRGQLRVPTVAEELGWLPRRINPALTYLRDKDLARVGREHAFPWVAFSLLETTKTAAFARSC